MDQDWDFVFLSFFLFLQFFFFKLIILIMIMIDFNISSFVVAFLMRSKNRVAKNTIMLGNLSKTF